MSGKGASKGKISIVSHSPSFDMRRGQSRGPERYEWKSDVLYIENYSSKKETMFVKDDATIKQSVQIRYCDGVTVDVSPKMNAVVIDNCRKSYIYITSLISTIELINCEEVKVQVRGQVPSITIDKCVGVDCYFSKESQNIQLTTSLSSEVNLNYPKGNEKDNWLELTVPEQFIHKYVNGKLETTVSHLYGS